MTAQGTATVTRKPCRRCGATVDAFRDELGANRQLDIGHIPARLDITGPDYRDRLWELSEYKTVGWRWKPFPVRTWRTLRLEHQC